MAESFPSTYIGAMEQMMANGLPFMKMHGLGNDFVIINSRARISGRARPVMNAGLARAIGDRNRGIGFDQLAEIVDDAQADFGIVFWNSDGTEAEACGNASRCVADFVMTDLGREEVSFATRRGLLRARRLDDGRVSVFMGAPQLAAAEIPLAAGVDPLVLPLAGDPVAVGMGNPHCVFFVADAASTDPAERGPAVERNPLFPQATNVEFASVTGPDRLRMRVWERGTGITLACGSGACATAVAAHLRGLTGRHVIVDLDGGPLEIDWREDGVWMTGATAHVFDGVLTPAWLSRI